MMQERAYKVSYLYRFFGNYTLTILHVGLIWYENSLVFYILFVR
jgi:hypothetical protein